MPPDVTRLAPSPTGALHLGNARTFLVTWLLARQRGWRVPLRVENIDGPRVRRGAGEGAIADLRWLGLDFDGEPLFQSTRIDAHRAAVAALLDSGAAYPCVCTRADVDRAASAPHADDGSAVYPGTCRGRFASVEEARAASGREPAIRFRVDDDETLGWADRFAGPQTVAMRTLGDFVIAKADGTPSYQLAVVVDDADARVTQVVRGDDLIDSTPRQITLRRALSAAHALRRTGIPACPTSVGEAGASGEGTARAGGERTGRNACPTNAGAADPGYWHLPLLVGPDGRRLAKRHGDTRIAAYREAGVAPGVLLRKLAAWCGIENATPTTAADLLDRFDVARVPLGRIVVADREDALRP